MLARGEIIINIDCRSFLAPEAIYNMVAKFIENPEYGAATGNVEIDWNLIYERDQRGRYLLDGDGHYRTRQLSHKEKFLAKAQFMEYLTSFRLGRQFQDITGSMYTFSGAFSAFRREVLLRSGLYRDRTVAEDTDLTLDLQGQGVRLGFAEDAKAYLKPVISFERFYSQRIRWHRGQIEVIGVHLDWYGNFRKSFWRNFWLTLLLMIDHTFSFPRLIWMFLLPLFFLFGYAMTLIIEAIILMYVFYVLIDFANAFYCYQVSDGETKEKIKDSIQYCLVTPIFRLIAFYFRFGAYLEELKEPQAWTTPINPVRSIKDYRASFSGSYQKTLGLGQRLWQLLTGWRQEPAYYDEKIAELDTYGLERSEVGPKDTQEIEVIPDFGLENGQRKMDGVYEKSLNPKYEILNKSQ
jgi:cellulose synthase/poly-beta-1,6-N-acetylglucosamine synthase-like glycosyltransferase